MNNIIFGKVFENSAISLPARIRDTSGEYPFDYEISTISATVIDLLTGSTVATVSFDPSDVIYNELQTDDERWTKDDTGYNLLIPLSGSNFPDGDRVYRVEVRIDPIDAYGAGEPFSQVWELKCIAQYSQ